MIKFAFYGRTGPKASLPLEDYRLRELVRVRDFARRHDGQVVADHYDGVPASVPLAERPEGAGLMKRVTATERDIDAVVIRHIGRALGPDACCDMFMFADASMPVWITGLGGPFRIDWIEHWRHLSASALIKNCEQDRCKSRLRAVRSLREGRRA